MLSQQKIGISGIKIAMHNINQTRQYDATSAVMALEDLVRNIDYDALMTDKEFAAHFFAELNDIAITLYSHNAYLCNAMALERTGLVDEALSKYAKARSFSPTNWRAYLYPARLEIERGHYESVEALLLQMYRYMTRGFIPSKLKPTKKNLADMYDMLSAVNIAKDNKKAEFWKNMALGIGSDLKYVNQIMSLKSDLALTASNSAAVPVEPNYPGTNRRRKVGREERRARAALPQQDSEGFFAKLRKIGSTIFAATEHFTDDYYGYDQDAQTSRKKR